MSTTSAYNDFDGKRRRIMIESLDSLAIKIGLRSYLTFEALYDDTTVTLTASSASGSLSVYVSTNNGSTWNSVSSTTDGAVLGTLNSGDKLLVKGENVRYGSGSWYNTFGASRDVYAYGNIMSLIAGDNFVSATELTGAPGGQTLRRLFYNMTTLRSCRKARLCIGATSLKRSRDFIEMFMGCTGLEAPPFVAIDSISEYAFNSMFYGCTSLKYAPDLPTKELESYCYSQAFYGCSSLTKLPKIEATTLATYCYNGMFSHCTGLADRCVLPVTTLAQGCYTGMFSYSSLPSVELPAATLVDNCYRLMFRSSSIKRIKCLATDISASNCLAYWLTSVGEGGTFIKAANMTSWPTGQSGIPSGWTVVDAE